MAHDDTYDDEFQLVNEFENLNTDELDKELEHNSDDGSDEENEKKQIINISQKSALKQEELKLQRNKQKLKEEWENIDKLKKELQLKLNEQNEIIEKSQQASNFLKQQSNEYNQLSTSMKKEIENLKTLRLSIEEEKKIFKSEFEKFANEKKNYEKDCNELKNIITKLNNGEKNKTGISLSKNEDVYQQLNSLLNSENNNNDQIEQEISRLRQLRKQQQDLTSQAKIEIQTLQSTHNAHLLAKLDITQAYCCKDCGTHIALESDIESRCYQVGHGGFTEKKRGYLFKNACNLVLGERKTENFTTGAYIIAWVSCVKCQQQIGWKYISTDIQSNTSKVGKYCLSRYLLVSPQNFKSKDISTSNNITFTTSLTTSNNDNDNDNDNDK